MLIYEKGIPQFPVVCGVYDSEIIIYYSDIQGMRGSDAVLFLSILAVLSAIDGESRSPPLAWPLAL